MKSRSSLIGQEPMTNQEFLDKPIIEAQASTTTYEEIKNILFEWSVDVKGDSIYNFRHVTIAYTNLRKVMRRFPYRSSGGFNLIPQLITKRIHHAVAILAQICKNSIR